MSSHEYATHACFTNDNPTYEHKVKTINDNYPHINIDNKDIYGEQLHDTELMRHNVLVDTLFWCVRIHTECIQDFKKQIPKNMHKKMTNGEPYTLVPYDWGNCLSLLTSAYGTTFTIVHIVNGSRGDLFLRSDALIHDPNVSDISIPVIDKSKPRFYLRGPKSEYKKFKIKQILEFYEMRCELSYETNLRSQLEILISNDCKHIILTGFECVDVSIAHACAHVLKEYKKKFHAICISIQSDIYNSFFSILNDEFECIGFPTTYDCPKKNRTFFNNYNYYIRKPLKPVTNTLYEYAINAPLRMGKGIFNAPRYYSNAIYERTHTDPIHVANPYYYGRGKYPTRRGGKNKTRRMKWNKTFKKKK